MSCSCSPSLVMEIEIWPHPLRALEARLGAEYAGHWAFHTNEPGPRHRARQKLGFGG